MDIRRWELYLNSFKTELAERLGKKNNRKWFLQYSSYFENKTGIEIGGPSPLFTKKIFPIYQLAKRIDGCNFSRYTIWEGDISSQEYHYFPGKTGTQYISEGSELSQIPNEEYDFLLSCHNLEHLANPLKAVTEWKRLVKKGGIIMLVLPDKRYTFDKKRPYTTFSHLLSDYENNTAEDDTTHIPEILNLHSLKLDPGLNNNYQEFKNPCSQNFSNRCAHHHVFSLDVLEQMFRYLSMEVIAKRFVPSIHDVVIGKKL